MVNQKKTKNEHKIGFIDRILEKLPEIHIRGYNFCGPNTDLANRLARGESGVNELDCACMEHDISYSENDDLKSRCIADKLLILKAIRRVYAKDSQIGERFTALIVSWLMSVKILLNKIELNISSVRRWLSLKMKEK